MYVKKSKEQTPFLGKVAVKEIRNRHKYWIGGYVFIALVCLGAYLLLQLKVFEVFGSQL